jgi:hypothetical protein
MAKKLSNTVQKKVKEHDANIHSSSQSSEEGEQL